MNCRGALACAALCIAVAALAWTSRVPALARVEVLVLLLLPAHLAWLAAVRARPGRRTVLAITVLLVALCVLARPVAEDDYWRFLWDGYRTLADGTPYGRPPADWFGDPSLPPAMQAVLDGINHPEVPTIYGPLLQALFLVGHLAAPADPLGLSILFGALHLACVAVATRYLPGHRIALAAWNPLLLQQCLANLHPDFLLGWLLLGAAIAARRGAAAALGSLLATAVATKVAALVAAPVLCIAVARAGPAKGMRLLRAAAAGLVMLVVLYLPWVASSGSEVAGLARFAEGWRFNPALFAPLAALVGDGAARPLAAALVGVAVLGLAAAARPSDAFRVVVLSLAALLALSPVVNAWYLAWLLPCAAMTRWRTPWAAAAALPLSTLTAGELGLAGDPFAIPSGVLALQWAVVVAALAADLRAQRARRRGRAAVAAGERTGAVVRSGPDGIDRDRIAP